MAMDGQFLIGTGIILAGIVWGGATLIARKADRSEIESLKLQLGKVMKKEDCDATEARVENDRQEIWRSIEANRVAIFDLAREMSESRGQIEAYAKSLETTNQMLLAELRKLNGK